jgi:hypothetical protein
VITAATVEEAALANGAQAFASEKDLLRLAAEWPGERLVEIWNGIPGVKAVTRFTNRKAGVSRVWKAVQGLAKEATPAQPAAAKEVTPAKAIRLHSSHTCEDLISGQLPGHRSHRN